MNTTHIGAPRNAFALNLAFPESKPGALLTIQSGACEVLSIEKTEECVAVRFVTRILGNPRFPDRESLEFELTAPGAPTALCLEWHGYSARLLVGGELVDEEWPVGELPGGNWDVNIHEAVKSWGLGEPAAAVEAEERFTGPMQFFLPPGHNTGTGDCMPFARDGRYCLYYLFDRRGHRSKAGLGAHQWAQISSNDLKTWTIHPMAVPVTDEWEGSICTGSLIQKDGITYAFYAARTSDGSPARLTWAVSGDGIHFTKSQKTFALTDPYEPVSARDPMVFLGADGQYHMLVTTSLVSMGRYGGCLAHLVSDDLVEWRQLDPFIVPGYADQPECSDYFEWNGWYYLVFSNFATARYRMSREPFGPWIKPECDILDTTENQVVKTAAFGARRLMTGFLAKYPRTYAGYAVTHELVQKDNGTLGVKFVEEILPDFGPFRKLENIELRSDEGRAEAVLQKDVKGFRLRVSLQPGGGNALFGLNLTHGYKEYRIDFDPRARRVCVLRPDQYFSGGEARNQITGIDLSGGASVDLIVYEDVLDLVLADTGRAHVMRLGDRISEGYDLGIWVQTGALCASEIEIAPVISPA